MIAGIGHNGAPPSRGEGWIALHRSIVDHPIVGFGQPVPPADPRRGSYSRSEAWLWLIQEAAFAERVFHGKDYKIEIARGQLVGGRRHLAEVWNWTEKRVRAFLGKLESELMITLVTDEIRSIRRANTPQLITLCNYLQYQLSGPAEGPAGGPTKGQRRANEGPTKGQIDNNDNNYNNSTPDDARAREPEVSGLKPDDPPSNVTAVDGWGSVFPQAGHDGVARSADGGVVLSNGTRAFWVEKFGGDEGALDLALIRVAGGLQVNSRQPLKLQVERQLAMIAGDRRDKDRRYETAVSNSRRADPPRRREPGVMDICLNGIADDETLPAMKTISGVRRVV